ncbi:hypothetical protein BBJ28_00014899 [Nothophytophthora sp. Chile5]|nr:hypothetical protein BBJ28_00014899 [Nothophytophthora sp. Chile5]
MTKIDEHVIHAGKGKARTTKCAHCDKVFASRSKDRWRQHMRGCESVPPEARRYFASIERRPFGGPRLSTTPSEAPSEQQIAGDTMEVATATIATAIPVQTSQIVNGITEVLLIHGPCSFVRGSWAGGNVSKMDLQREVQTLAAEAEVSLVTHDSNHEGQILDWLLNAKASEVIVSPFGLANGCFGQQSIELALAAAKNLCAGQL